MNTQDKSAAFNAESLHARKIQDMDSALEHFDVLLAEDMKHIRQTEPTNFEDRFKKTSPLDQHWRGTELAMLKQALQLEKTTLLVAMSKDFGISEEQLEILEYSPLMRELDQVLLQYKSWFNQSLDTPISSGFSSSKVFNLPMGTVVIFGSRQDELATLLYPLIHSIAGGNYTVLVPEASSSSTLAAIEYIVNKYLHPNRVFLAQRDLPLTQLEQIYAKHGIDMIFDSRGSESSKQNAALASKYGVRCVSNAPGKNVVVVDMNADIKECCKMIAEQKFYKAGQASSGIDLLYVEASIYPSFIEEFKKNIYYEHSAASPSMGQHGKLLDRLAFSKAEKDCQDANHGGILESTYSIHPDTLTIGPVLIKDPKTGSLILSQKHPNPILPIVTYKNLNTVIEDLTKTSDLGSLYFFSSNNSLLKDIKGLLPFKQVFFNTGNLYTSSAYTPNFDRFSVHGASAQGLFGLQTFTRQKLISRGAEPCYSISSRRFSFKPPAVWLNRLSRRHLVPAGLVSLALLYWA
jgi:aldehyde dehydrogenase (NAD+)